MAQRKNNAVASAGVTAQPAPAGKAASRARTATNFRIACGLAAIILFGAYSNHFRNGFHFDDHHVIESNLFIRSLGNIPLFFTDGSTFSSLAANATYRPLLTTTYAIDYAIAGGLDPLQFHITQFLLLLVLGSLLYLFFLRLMDEARPREANPWLALFAATFFCIHTANTETVNYLSSRSDLLSTTLVVLGFVLYLESPTARRTYLYLIPIALGALAKNPAVMFGPLLIAYHWLFDPQLQRERFWSRTAMALRRGFPALVACAVLFIFQSRMTPSTWAPSEDGPLAYLRTQPFVWLHYLRLFFLPIGLTADTDMRIIEKWYDTRVVAGLALIAVLAWLFWRFSQRRETAPIAFGLTWFAVALAPTSSIFPLAEVANEHRIFFPYIGLTLACVWMVAELAGASLERKTDRRVARAIAAAGVILLVVHGVGTFVRNRAWKNGETLWLDVTQKSPSNGRALMNYGLTQMSAGNYEAAKSYFDRAHAISPNYSTLEINLGVVNGAMKRPVEAEQHFRRAMTLNPDANANFYYARWLVQQNRGAEALPLLREAVRLGPADPAPRELLMKLLAAIGSPELKTLALQTLEIAPENEVARAYATKGYHLQGIGTGPRALFEAGTSAIGRSDFVTAAQANRAALAANPRDADALNNLGWSLAKLGFYSEAVGAFEQAVEARPEYSLARNNLAWAQSEMQKRGRVPAPVK